MDKKVIGLLIISIISVVFVSGCIGEDGLELYENQYLSFKFSENFTQTTANPDRTHIVYDRFEDYEKNEVIFVQIWKTNSSFDDMYDFWERTERQKNYTLDYASKKVIINGVPSIRESIQYENTTYKYRISMSFVKNGFVYAISFSGDDLQSLESHYDTVASTIEIK